MIKLFLNNTEVFPADANLKLTKVNSFVAQAGEYTYEIAIPLSIYQNAVFFPNWRALQSTRRNRTYTAELYLNNQALLVGSARVTKATEKIVYVQLLSAFSDIEKLHGEEYIDELLLPGYNYVSVFTGNEDYDYDEYSLMKKFKKWKEKPSSYYVNPDSRGLVTNATYIGDDPRKYTVFPVYDCNYEAICNYMYTSSSGNIYVGGNGFINVPSGKLRAVGFSPNWNLLYVVQCIFEYYGYKLVIDYESYPQIISHIYLAMPGSVMAEALPHWTVKEFLSQARTFFNADFQFSGKNVVMRNKRVVSYNTISYEPIDDYSIESIEEKSEEANIYDGYKYDQSSVEYHTADQVDDEIINGIPTHTYSTYQTMVNAYNIAAADKKENDLWSCPYGHYCQWDGTLTRIDIFGKIDKTGKVDETVLKIVPAAIAEIPNYGHMPALEVILPDTEESERDSVQSYIEGNSSIEDTKKFDLIEIALCDTARENGIPSAFTSSGERPQGVPHDPISLSLRAYDTTTETMKDMYTYNKDIKYDSTKKYKIKFLADHMPNADSIFIFKNRRFIPEKLDIDIKDGKMVKVVSGEFYLLK